MYIKELLSSDTPITTKSRNATILKSECSQFLSESKGCLVYKALPSSYSDFQKVKVRFKKTEDVITSVFNDAFITETNKLRQRAIFTNSVPPILPEGHDLYCVFPINNYKFLYSTEVTNSTSDYRRVIDTLFEAFDDKNKATDIVTDLLKYTYSTTKLVEGIQSDCEIIFHNIPYYYAVKYSQLHLFY